MRSLLSCVGFTTIQGGTYSYTSQGTITCDVSTGVACPRPYIPLEFRRIVVDALHSLSHPGIRATQHLLNKRLIWPGINRDVRNWAKSCLSCQRAKVHRHTKSQFFSCTRFQV